MLEVGNAFNETLTDLSHWSSRLSLSLSLSVAITIARGRLGLGRQEPLQPSHALSLSLSLSSGLRIRRRRNSKREDGSREARAIATCNNHHNPKVVRAIELPNGTKQLFTGGQDEAIRTWDCDTGKCTSINPVGGDIGCLHSKSGYLFAGLPNEVRVWHLQTSAEQTLTGPVGQVHAITVYNDILLAGVQDGNILAWKFNPTTQLFDPVASLGGHTGAVIALEVADDKLFSGSTDKSVRVWDLISGQCIQVIDANTHDVTSLIYWQQYLISSSLDGKMKVWAKTQNGTFELEYTYPEDHETKEDLDGILSLCGFIDKEEKPILLCSNNNTVRVFEIPSFTEIGMMFSKKEVRSLQVGPGGLLFSGDSSGEIKVWKWNPSTSFME